ncbi:MAG TPA: hypothetical protein VGB23_05750, partial [Nitrospirota bacterium]
MTSLKCRLVELVPVERLSRYLDGVASATGISVSVLGDGGEVIVSASLDAGGGQPSFPAGLWERFDGVSADGPGKVEGPDGTVLLRVPVVHRDLRLGWAAVRVDGVEQEQRRAMDVVALTAAHIRYEADTGYEVESLSGEVVRVYEELALIFGITARLGAIVDVTEICRVVAEEAGRLLDAKDILVQLVDENIGALKTVYAQGEHAEESYGFAPGVEDGLD